MTQGSKYSAELKAAVVAEYAEGASAVDVGLKYGVGQTTVRSWAKVFGVAERSRHESPNVLENGRWVQDGFIQRWVS